MEKSISIHASEKEATIAGAADKLGYAISIHASEKEATLYQEQTVEVAQFQSTPPRRRRHLSMSGYVPVGISIHASEKEATHRASTGLCDQRDFNPRLREGGDYYSFFYTILQMYFNPRLREGGDVSCTTSGLH